MRSTHSPDAYKLPLSMQPEIVFCLCFFFRSFSISSLTAVYLFRFVICSRALLESFLVAHLKSIRMLSISLRVFVKVDVVLWAREVRTAQRFLVDEDAWSRWWIRLRENKKFDYLSFHGLCLNSCAITWYVLLHYLIFAHSPHTDQVLVGAFTEETWLGRWNNRRVGEHCVVVETTRC